MVDIASRVYNHKWKIDPIVRSLIDTDFYKLLMCQSVFRNKPETNGQTADVPARLHGMVRGLPHARLPSRKARRPV